MSKRLIIFIFILFAPILGGGTGVYAGAKGGAKPIVPIKPKPKGPIEAILLSNEFGDHLKNPKRYTPPPALLKRIEKLSDEEKEKLLLKWFLNKDKSFLRSMAFWSLAIRVTVLTIVTAFVAFVAGAWILTQLQEFLNMLRPIIDFVMSILPESISGRNYVPQAPQFIKDLFSGGYPLLGIPIKLLLRIFGVTSEADYVDKVNIIRVLKGFGTLFAFFASSYVFRYLSIPAQYYWNTLRTTAKIFTFYYNPRFENVLERAENLYIISYYLFSPVQRRLMEELLLSTRAGDTSKVNEVEMFIKTHRAAPYGVKHIVYDQEKIDICFAGYSPELKAFAEELIALLVIYTEALESGKEELLANLSIKGVLLYGPPGTGKSHFFKMICKATGLNHIVLNIMDPEVDLRGKTGDKVGYGTPSALAKGYLAGADPKTGRTYKNSPVIIEEIDKSAALEGGTQAYYHIILDPKGESMKDDYLHYELKRPHFMWATTNYRDTLPEAMRDRFSLFYVGNIPKTLKKQIARDVLVPLWVNLLCDPDLQAKHNYYLSEQECRDILTERLERFIEKTDEPGMRGCEDEAKNTSLEIVVAKHKQEEDVVGYMAKLQEWKEEQAELGNDIDWDEEELLEDLEPEDREWQDIRLEMGTLNEALAQTQWLPPAYKEEYEADYEEYEYVYEEIEKEENPQELEVELQDKMQVPQEKIEKEETPQEAKVEPQDKMQVPQEAINMQEQKKKMPENATEDLENGEEYKTLEGKNEPFSGEGEEEEEEEEEPLESRRQKYADAAQAA